MGPTHNGGWIIVLTFVAALMLTMVPLPGWGVYLRPEWVTMVMIYWCMALPERVGIGYAWMAGLLLDVIHGAVLGQYAMALAVIAYVTLHLHQRMRVYPLGQQALIVLMLLSLQQLMVIWVNGFLGEAPRGIQHWLPAFISMLLWPWLFLILRDVRRKFRVN